MELWDRPKSSSSLYGQWQFLVKTTKTLTVTVPLRIMITVSVSIFCPLDDPDTKVHSILAIFRNIIFCKRNIITSMCFICYFNMLLPTSYIIWIPRIHGTTAQRLCWENKKSCISLHDITCADFGHLIGWASYDWPIFSFFLNSLY